MTATLIVNADDFGLTTGTNNAILRAHREGLVTSTSLLANGGAFDHALTLIRDTPTLDVGLHLTLTECKSAASAVEVPDLLTENGELPLSNQPFARALMLGQLPVAQIRREFEAQAARLVDLGIQPTHVDGHKYIHLLPGIAQIVAELAQRFGIPVMRVPRRVADPMARMGRIPGLMALVGMSVPASRWARRYDLATVDQVIGFVDTGHLDHPALNRLLEHPLPGVTELLCHPGDPNPELDALLAKGCQWIEGYDFTGETRAVADPAMRAFAQTQGWQLRSFRRYRDLTALDAEMPAT